MHKLNEYIVANALAVTTGIVYVACRLLVGIFPDGMFRVAQSWFHGIALSRLGSWNLTNETLILGLVSSAITAWVVGYIFAKVYNAFVK